MRAKKEAKEMLEEEERKKQEKRLIKAREQAKANFEIALAA